MYSRLLGAALLLMPIFGGCSCEEDPLNPTDPPAKIDAGFFTDATVFPDAAEDAGEPVDSGPPDTGIPEARVLTFDGTSPVGVFFNASVDLPFTLRTVSGAAVPAENIRLTLSSTVGGLSAASITTNAGGSATVRFTARNFTGSAVLTAEADLAPSVNVVINVGEDPNADLELIVRSSARINVTASNALVYVGAAASVPTCAQLYAGNPPAATLTAMFTALPGTQRWNMLNSGSLVTAYATGTNARGDVVARGCVEGTRLNGAQLTTINLVLEQLPPNLDGDYDALLQVDLGAGLPPPFGPVIVTITDILSDPAGWAVYQTLALVDRQVGSSFASWVPPGGSAERIATFDEVRNNPSEFPTWVLASNSLDNFLVQQLGQAYIDVTNVGADLSHVIREFEIGSGYTVTSTGVAGRVQVVESWKALVFQWRLNCPNGDMGCARRPVVLSGPNAHLAPLQATYGASVTHAPDGVQTERYRLALGPHSINLRYGAVIVLVLNTIVFPSLPAGIAGNNLQQVLANIVQCPDVAISLSNATGFPASFFQTICDNAVNAAARFVENQILQLDSNNNPGFLGGAGAAGGGEMFFLDADQDLRTELVPAVRTYAAWVNSNGSTQAINAPIDGDGRREASACASDTDCAPQVCVPVPHYLKVRSLERDCRRPVGAAAGGVGCAVDADCASGLCFDPGNGVRICYGACAGTCALGTCTADAFRMDLNPVLNGLGNGTIAACVP